MTLFAGKAAYYARYRPDYPPEAIAALVERASLTGKEVVADLGSGTGILTKHLLEHAALVYGIEPAEDMRRVAEESFEARGHEHFRSIAGTAEDTRLPPHSVDVIACGNSFHYFDVDRARAEAERILRAHGRIVLLFHDSPLHPQGFTREYLEFLQQITPPQLSKTHDSDEHDRRIARYLGREPKRDRGEETSSLTWESVRGRFLSSSLAAGDEAILALREIFDRHAANGRVSLTLSWTVAY